ncbi:hypothetical protein [Massilia sp. Leaf139]|uniref:hypothetical protein n=1 Tax=Massilia sp. Leaf139 TaxID=1736272 RepID=UPI0006FA095B|nr:hypothetical protein [Massilia sp. Leaf139]KQQ88016.1 hypothetical protein ASF77_14965 [Massilia sp. Leaf139]
MQLPAYLRLVRASAFYDIVVTGALATPWTLPFAHALMSHLNQQLGGAALPAFAPFHMFIGGLLGSVVLVWSLLRLRMPSLVLGRHDGAARFLFSGWMVWALAQTGAPVLWLLLVPEFAWGVAQWWPVAPAAVPQSGVGRLQTS